MRRSQAQAEGLALLEADNKTGYFGVYPNNRNSKPYEAQVRRGGKMVHLGSFATAEEAALCVARSPEGQAAAKRAAARAPLTSEEARRQAEAEGLILLVAQNRTGYFGVRYKPGKSKPYQARVRRGGNEVSLASFVTAEEAALCIARSPEGRAAATRAAWAPRAPTTTSGEARRQAEAEGVTLRVADNTTGYFGVYLTHPSQPKPYQAKLRRGYKYVHLGSFATAEEAALCIARSPEGQAAAASPAPPMTSEEARQQAQAEGLTLRVATSKSGFFGVHHQPHRPKPYQAKLTRGGKEVYLGLFATAEEAALRIARSQAPPLVASEDSAGWAAGQEPQVPSDDGGDEGEEQGEEGEDECEVLDAVEVPDDEWTDDDTGVVSS